MFILVNRTLFASNKQLEEAKKLLNDYKQNPQMKVDAERLWGAKKGNNDDDDGGGWNDGLLNKVYT